MPTAKKVHSYSSDTWIPCCWFECDRDGYELYKAIFHEHGRNYTCDHPAAAHINFVFCSERHKQLYLHSHVQMGQLPPGYRLAI